jgi:hypothetical protein
MTANKCDSQDSLLRLVPEVLRARGFRLYTKNGKRLTDLWQNNGAAILGHTAPALLRELKNTASRGLFAPYPHFMEGRFIKALERLFPGRVFRLYASPPAALETLIREKSAALWRPFLDADDPLAVAHNAPPVLVPVLPGISGWRGGLPQGLCVLALARDFSKTADALPAGELLPPALLAFAVRGLYDLIAAAPSRAKPAFPRIAKALRESPWQRQGIYLYLRSRAEAAQTGAYQTLFLHFLENGFLLPPDPANPAILPAELSQGEETKLAACLHDLPGRRLQF